MGQTRSPATVRRRRGADATGDAARPRRRRWSRRALAATALVAMAASLSGCHEPPWQSQLVSVNAAGTDSGNDESRNPWISADGTRVAFESNATDLGATDTNGVFDIYVRDLTTGTTELASVNATGSDGGDDDSFFPQLSSDGTKVGFNSQATDLVAQAVDGSNDNVFVRDLDAGTTTLISVDPAGTAGGNGQSNLLQFSPDGNRVLLYSRASNLVPGGTAADAIYERDLTAGVTTRLGEGFSAAYSPSGDAVAFVDNENLYLYDVATGTIRLLVGGELGTHLRGRPVFSHDGTRIAFERWAQPDHVRSDIYVYDRVTRTTTLVTVAAGGSGGSDNTPSLVHGFHPTDANRLLFSSMASNLVADDTNGRLDLFVRDLVAGVTTRLASDVGHRTASMALWLGNGASIGFVSGASGYGVTDTNEATDVYVLDVASGAFTVVSTEATGHDAGDGDSGRYVYFPGELGGFSLLRLSASADGTRLAFGSYAGDLGPTDGDRPSDHDVYVATLGTP